MGVDDKARNTGQEWQGKAKEALGDATDDRELESEGQKDQTSASLKQACERFKDAFR